MELTLAVLASLTRFAVAVLFTFDFSRVSCQKATLVERFAIIWIEEQECSSDTMADSTSLAGEASAFDVDHDVEFTKVAR